MRVTRFIPMFRSLIFVTMSASGGIAQDAGEPQTQGCLRPELAWEFWSDFTVLCNPGIEYAEQKEPQRARLLAELSCVKGGSGCPPDHVYAFHSEGNGIVMVVFVTKQCVTRVEEMPVAHFRSVAGGDFEC